MAAERFGVIASTSARSFAAAATFFISAEFMRLNRILAFLDKCNCLAMFKHLMQLLRMLLQLVDSSNLHDNQPSITHRRFVVLVDRREIQMRRSPVRLEV